MILIVRVTAAAVCIGFLGLAGCTVTHPDALAPRAATAPGVVPPRQAPVSVGSISDYRVLVAKHIESHSAEHVYGGAPQPMLRGVIVMSLVVQADGRTGPIKIVRSNGHRELERTAERSVKQAEPFPAPPSSLTRKGHVEYMETWLFNDDGRFRLLSIAPEQAWGS